MDVLWHCCKKTLWKHYFDECRVHIAVHQWLHVNLRGLDTLIRDNRQERNLSRDHSCKLQLCHPTAVYVSHVWLGRQTALMFFMSARVLGKVGTRCSFCEVVSKWRNPRKIRRLISKTLMVFSGPSSTGTRFFSGSQTVIVFSEPSNK